MIFCKDCKWRRGLFCDAPQNRSEPVLNLVTGECDQNWIYMMAGVCRQSVAEDACGPEASWFQPKEPT